MVKASKSLLVSCKAVPDYIDCVQVDVGTGDSLKSFTIHTAFLTARSPFFFKKALAEKGKETENRVIELPEDKPSTFSSTYIHHLYTGQLAVKLAALPFTVNLSVTMNVRYESLSHLNVLAEKFEDIKSKNTILRFMSESCTRKRSDDKIYIPGLMPVRIIYNGTLPVSPARRLLVDLWTSWGIEDCLESNDAPSRFMRDLIINLMSRRTDVPHPAETYPGAAYMEDVPKEKV